MIKNKDTMERFLVNHNIKTVKNLWFSVIEDAFNPSQQNYIDTEDQNIKYINEKNNLKIKHVSIHSNQVPSKKMLIKFFEVLDDKATINQLEK